jgi:DNA-binding transcriptional ArsR family regulator
MLVMARTKKRPAPLSEAALGLVAARFRALGDPSRLAILNHLMSGERGVQDLLAETGLSQTNLSRHLGVLRHVGIVERRSEGNRAFYRIGDPCWVEVCDVVCGSLASQLAENLEAIAGGAS